MTRDMDLIRNIMLDVEAAPVGQEINGNLEYDGKDQFEIADHVLQLKEQGLIEGLIVRDGRNVPRGYVIWRLTPAGHDFLDSARNATFWNKAMTELKKQGIGLTIGITTAYLKQKVKEQLGLTEDSPTQN